MKRQFLPRLRDYRVGALLAAAVVVSSLAAITPSSAAVKQPVTVVTSVNGVVGASAAPGATTTVSFAVTNRATNGLALTSFSIVVPPGLGKISSSGTVGLSGVFATGKWSESIISCGIVKSCSAIVSVNASSPTSKSQVAPGGTVTASISFKAPTAAGAINFSFLSIGNGAFALSGPNPSITVGTTVSYVFDVTAPSAFVAGTAQNVTVHNAGFTGGSVSFTVTGDDSRATVAGTAFGTTGSVANKSVTVSIASGSVTSGSFTVPVMFTAAQQQNLTVKSGSGATMLSGSAAPFVVSHGAAIVTVAAPVDTSLSPPLQTPLANALFSVGFSVADTYGNVVASVPATLSAINASPGTLTITSTNPVTTNSLGAGSFTAKYSAGKTGLQLQVAASGATGSTSTDITPTVFDLTVPVPGSFDAGVAQNVTVHNASFRGGSVTFTDTSNDAIATVAGTAFGMTGSAANKSVTVVIPSGSVTNGSFTVPVIFTHVVAQQNLAVTYGSGPTMLSGSVAPFVVNPGVPIVTVLAPVDISSNPPLQTPAANDAFTIAFSVADGFGNVFANYPATLSAPNAAGGILTVSSANPVTTDSTGAGSFTATYSIGQAPLQLTVDVAGASGSYAANIALAAAPVVQALPDVPVVLPPFEIPGGITANVNLPGGAYGPVYLYAAQQICDPNVTAASSGYVCNTDATVTTLDFISTLGNTHLYNDLKPASLSLTCLDADCPVVGPSSSMVAAGKAHSCVVQTDATVACWGLDNASQLGDWPSTTSTSAPQTVPGLSGIVAVTSGRSVAAAYGLAPGVSLPESTRFYEGSEGIHTCALRNTGTVSCWGDGRLFQQGMTYAGTPEDVISADTVSPLATVTAIAAGASHTCALKADTTVWCWGWNTSQQTGGPQADSSEQYPVQVMRDATTALTGVRAIVAGGDHSCALLTDGTAGCWGDNSFGQLGQGSAGASSRFFLPVSSITGITAISAGANHTCAATGTNTIWCWGDNSSGQLGAASNSGAPYLPVTFNLPTDGSVTSLATGTSNTCAATSLGSVYCWGDNTYGESGSVNLGLSTPSGPWSSYGPQYVGSVGTEFGTNSAASIVGLAAGDFHMCALLSDRSVSCWGRDDSGQLGNAAASTSGTNAAPLAVSGLAPLLANQAKFDDFIHYPILLALKVSGTYLPFGFAPACQDVGEPTAQGTISSAAGKAVEYCADVNAFSRISTPGSLSQTILFVEDPMAKGKV
ncbi:MAG: hypothetical protein WCI29_06170 [Actinomycetes bacterium]